MITVLKGFQCEASQAEVLMGKVLVAVAASMLVSQLVSSRGGPPRLRQGDECTKLGSDTFSIPPVTSYGLDNTALKNPLLCAVSQNVRPPSSGVFVK